MIMPSQAETACRSGGISSTIPYFPSAVNYLIDNGLFRGAKLEIKDRDLTKEDNDYAKRVAKIIQEYIELQEE